MSKHAKTPLGLKKGMRCICNWPDCDEFETKLEENDDVLAGYVRLRFDGKTSESVQLQNAVHKLLHTPNEKRSVKRPYVARHHFTPAHLQNHDSTGGCFKTPITKEQAESGFLYSQGRIDPILIFKEKDGDDGSSQNASFPGELAGRKLPPPAANTVRYIQGPTVPRSFLSFLWYFLQFVYCFVRQGDIERQQRISEPIDRNASFDTLVKQHLAEKLTRKACVMLFHGALFHTCPISIHGDMLLLTLDSRFESLVDTLS